jgi:hypothetical protein
LKQRDPNTTPYIKDVDMHKHSPTLSSSNNDTASSHDPIDKQRPNDADTQNDHAYYEYQIRQGDLYQAYFTDDSDHHQ